MEKNKVINSVYLLPGLLEKLNGNTNDNIEKILLEFDVKAEDYKNLKNLLTYHLDIIKTDFKPNYIQLREGLDEYFNEYLLDFWNVINIGNERSSLLDYGCGNGSYSYSFLENFPRAEITLIDKSMGIDFEKNPGWYIKDNYNCHDIVLLSEILHCKDLKGQKYLIDSSICCLVKGGTLVINENIDPFMGWRLNKLTANGNMMSEDDIIGLMSSYKELSLKSIKSINYHKVYIYEKV